MGCWTGFKEIVVARGLHEVFYGDDDIEESEEVVVCLEGGLSLVVF